MANLRRVHEVLVTYINSHLPYFFDDANGMIGGGKFYNHLNFDKFLAHIIRFCTALESTYYI